MISAVVFLLSLAAISYLSSAPASYPNEQHSPAETKAKDQTEKEHSLSGFVRFMLPDAISIFTFWLVLATAGLGIIAIYQISFLRRGEQISANTAQAAKDSADAAKNALIATQRAWIRPKLSITSPLTFDQNGASTAVGVEVVNVGNTPALSVTPHIWMMALTSAGPYPWQEQQRRCSEIRRGGFALGFTLFPGEKFPTERGIGSYSLGVNTTRDEIERALPASRDGKFVSLYVYGCIDYRFPTDQAIHHQTGFVLQLGKRGGPISPDDGTVPLGELMLTDSGLGIGEYAD